MAETFSVTKSTVNPNTINAKPLDFNVGSYQNFNASTAVEEVDLNSTSHNRNANREIGLMDRIAATFVVGETKLAQGTLKTGEKIIDGIANLDADIIGTTATQVGGVVSYFDKDAGNVIADWGNQYIKDMHDFVAYDMAESFEEGLYNTRTMDVINDISYMKHDSTAANNLSIVSNTVSEIALATVAMVYSGGTASSFLVGAISGYGEAGEYYYKMASETNAKQKAGMIVGALSGGLKYIAFSHLGSAVMNLGTQSTALGTTMSNEGVTLSETISNARKYIATNGWQKVIGDALRSNFGRYSIADVAHEISEETSIGMMNDEKASTIAKDSAWAGTKAALINLGFGLAGAVVGNIFIPKAFAGFEVSTTSAFATSEVGVVSIGRTLVEIADAAEDSGIFKILFRAVRTAN